MKNVFIITCVLNKRFNFYIYWLHAFEPGIFIVYIVYVLWKKKKKKNTDFELLGYFSQQIFQKEKVAGMKLFVYAEEMWAFTFPRASRGCLKVKGANGGWAWPH